MFNIKQRVICCSDDFSNVPIKDKVYTVRDITQGIGGEVVCLLNEIHNPRNQKGVENGYNVERFVRWRALLRKILLSLLTPHLYEKLGRICYSDQ